MLGQPEGNWLDVKKQDYDLASERGKLSLAQDIARFANGEDGGVLIVGMDTDKKPSGERIKSIRPIKKLPNGVRRHLRVIDDRVFPPVDGLSAYEVDADDGSLLVIHFPPQPEELKPFLVIGAIVGDKYEGAFISIVRRRGEDSVPIRAEAIHSSLAAGRALLRHGQSPPRGEQAGSA